MFEECCWGHGRRRSQWSGCERAGPVLVMKHLLDPDNWVMNVSEVNIDVVIFPIEQAVLRTRHANHLVSIGTILIWAFPVRVGRSYRLRTKHADHAAAPCLTKPCEVGGLDLGGGCPF